MATYLNNGYLDFENIVRKGYPFNILLGGRGIGKTYGALAYVVKTGTKFYFTRRTEKQLDELLSPDLDPFRDINRNLGTNWILTRKKGYRGTGVFKGYPDPDDPEKVTLSDRPLGVCKAFSTAANTRGIGGGVEFKIMICDEFIKLDYERDLKGEDTAFFDLYESINRNRELPPPHGLGEPPLQAFLLSNSNRVDSPILASWGLVGRVAKMQQTVERTGKDQFFEDPKRGIFLAYYADSPISKMKATTALYKSMAEGSSYSEMALSNKFAGVSFSDIGTFPLKEVMPVCSVGEITIYRHKGSGIYWVSTHRQPAPRVFGSSGSEFEKFSKRCREYLAALYQDKVIFEDYTAKMLFNHYFSY